MVGECQRSQEDDPHILRSRKRANSLHLPNQRNKDGGEPEEWFRSVPIVVGVSAAVAEREFARVRKPRVVPLPWLIVKGKHERCRGLLDTGASINLISESVLAKFSHRLTSRYHVHLIGINGEPTRLNEWYDVEMQLPNGEAIEVTMLCGLEEKIGMILGMPFLVQIDAKIEIRDQMIRTEYGIFGYGQHNYNDRALRRHNLRAQAMVAMVEKEQQMMEEALRDTALSEKGMRTARELMVEYAETWQPNSLGTAEGYTHHFVLAHNRPVVLPPRVLAEKFYEEIEKQTDEMLKQDVIEPSTSPYRFWPVIVIKKGGTWRFAIDY